MEAETRDRMTDERVKERSGEKRRARVKTSQAVRKRPRQRRSAGN
jgi:hypothetical protein